MSECMCVPFNTPRHIWPAYVCVCVCVCVCVLQCKQEESTCRAQGVEPIRQAHSLQRQLLDVSPIQAEAPRHDACQQRMAAGHKQWRVQTIALLKQTKSSGVR